MIRVATFNIRNGLAEDGLDAWGLRRHRTVALIKGLDADLFGLQEVMDFQLEFLLEQLPEYDAVGVGRDDGLRGGEFNPILYRRSKLSLNASDTYWLSDTPSVPGSSSWGNENIRICTWAAFTLTETGRSITYFNTHLDHESQPSRLKSIELILSRLTAGPTILGGDFNVGEDDEVVERVRNAGYVDTFRVLRPEASDVGTFNAFTDTFEPDKIDYLLVGPGMAVVDAEIVKGKMDGRWPSDHAAVTVKIAWRS